MFDYNGQVIGVNFAEKACSKETLLAGYDCEYMVGYGLQVKHLRELLCKKRVWERMGDAGSAPQPSDDLAKSDNCREL